jgi:hypothetical protein
MYIPITANAVFNIASVEFELIFCRLLFRFKQAVIQTFIFNYP